MRIPDSLASLVDHGILEQVLRPLMSGKEAQVYLVVSNGEVRVAKVYKEAQNRTFQNRAEYTEGRKVRSSRDQRAMQSRSRYGRAQDEAAWRSAEVDMIYRLASAGVRVPAPYHFIDGVLIMELVKDAEGNPAPRLGDLVFTQEEARAIFDQLIGETVRMLCAGVVHGDLSDFNVLMGEHGPVIIDFPQAVNASGNQNARRILLRDVANLQRFLQRHAPDATPTHYGEEMWQLYERNALSPDTRLTGRYKAPTAKVSADAVLSLVKDAEREERRRREGLHRAMRGLPPEQPRQGGGRSGSTQGANQGAGKSAARGQGQGGGQRSAGAGAQQQPSRWGTSQQGGARQGGAQQQRGAQSSAQQSGTGQGRGQQRGTQQSSARPHGSQQGSARPGSGQDGGSRGNAAQQSANPNAERQNSRFEGAGRGKDPRR